MHALQLSVAFCLFVLYKPEIQGCFDLASTYAARCVVRNTFWRNTHTNRESINGEKIYNNSIDMIKKWPKKSKNRNI